MQCETEMFQGCCRGATDFTGCGLRLRTDLPNRGRLQRCVVAKRLTKSFFNRSVLEVAPDLIGVTLLVNGVGGRLVEVEAYHHTEPAAHSFGGKTERNAVMFGPAGYAYVYRSYGIHWCLNFVCEAKGSAAAVLIRAIEPTVASRPCGGGAAWPMCGSYAPAPAGSARRSTSRGHNGLALDRPPFELFAREGAVEVVAGPRIGITKAADLPWRYGEEGSRFLSKPF